MATVKHLVDSKTDSRHYAVKANETVLKALRVMAGAYAHRFQRHIHIDEYMALMLQSHIRHLPVVNEGTLLGIVSMCDVVAAALEEREAQIKGPEGFIHSSGFSRSFF